MKGVPWSDRLRSTPLADLRKAVPVAGRALVILRRDIVTRLNVCCAQETLEDLLANQNKDDLGGLLFCAAGSSVVLQWLALNELLRREGLPAFSVAVNYDDVGPPGTITFLRNRPDKKFTLLIN